MQIERLDDGTRHVTAISEVQRMEGDVITLQPLFEFKLERFTEDGKVIGDLVPTGLRPAFLPKFKRHGIELPDEIFGTAVARDVRHQRRAGCSGELGAGGRRVMRLRVATLLLVLAAVAFRRRSPRSRRSRSRRRCRSRRSGGFRSPSAGT